MMYLHPLPPKGFFREEEEAAAAAAIVIAIPIQKEHKLQADLNLSLSGPYVRNMEASGNPLSLGPTLWGRGVR